MSDNRIVYGLLKEYGVDTSNLSPKEAWELLKKIKKNNEKSANNAISWKNDKGAIYYKPNTPYEAITADELRRQKRLKNSSVKKQVNTLVSSD